MNENDLQQIEEMLGRHLDAFFKDICHKLDIIIAGQQMIAERMDRIGRRPDERMEKALICHSRETCPRSDRETGIQNH